MHDATPWHMASCMVHDAIRGGSGGVEARTLVGGLHRVENPRPEGFVVSPFVALEGCRVWLVWRDPSPIRALEAFCRPGTLDPGGAPNLSLPPLPPLLSHSLLVKCGPRKKGLDIFLASPNL